MSNNWNRVKYDQCRHEESINDSVTPMNYRLYPGQNRSCNQCIIPNGPRNTSESTTYQPNETVDIESKLRNIDGKYNSRSCRKDTRDFFKPGSATMRGVLENAVPTCKTGDTITSRLDVPQSREMSTWEYNMDFPPIPPQDNIYFINPVSSRLQVKDVYDPKLAICREFKKMKDQTHTYPTEKSSC